MRNLIFILILFCGCSKLLPTPAPKIDEYDAKAKASVSILLTETNKDSQPSPQPDNAPKPGDKCETCKGTGKVGDGRVFSTCLDCNGTGKVPAKELPQVIPISPVKDVELPKAEVEDAKPFKPADEKKQEVIKKKLVAYTAPWCTACHKWLETRAKSFTDLGVEVVALDYDVQPKPIVLPGGKQVTSIPAFVYYENDVPVKWFVGDLTVEFMRSQGINL